MARPRVSKLAALCVLGLASTSLQSSAGAVTGVRAFSDHLEDFELRRPVSTTNFEENWHLEGGAIPCADDQTLILSAGISGRGSWFVSKKKLPSADFEVAFKFQQEGLSRDTHKQGFGIWYIHDDQIFSDDRTDEVTGKKVQDPLKALIRDPEPLKTGAFSFDLLRLGYDLLGYKSKFDGVATLFTTRTVDYVQGNAPDPKFNPSAIGKFTNIGFLFSVSSRRWSVVAFRTQISLRRCFKMLSTKT